MAKSGAIEDPDKLRSLLARVVLSPVFQFLMATALGTVIYFARAPAAYVSPYLFAEDWGWTSRVITRGFWDTALHARSDYVILGNVIVIWLGIQLANWCCGDVFSIPECIAVVSYVFFAATAALPLLLLRRQLPATWRWLAWLLVCVMPLGIHSWSGFEILGRSANVGFVFVYIAFVLLWYRNTSVRTFWQALPVDLGLFVCTATNPICIAMLAATVWPTAHRWLAERIPLRRLVRETAFASLCLLAVACIAINGLPKSRPPRLMSSSPPVGIAGAVEMGLARGLLYPLVWPFYRHLSTWSTLAIAAGAAAGAWRIVLPRHRAVVIAAIATVALVSTVLVLRRGELAADLGGYRSTRPDRYFLGQNLVATLLVVVVAADVEKWLRGCPRFAWLPTAALLAFAAAAVIHEPLWKISNSQFLMINADDAVRVTARRALRDRCFVNANRRCDPDGEFLEIWVHCLRPLKPLYLPRRDVERSLEPIATRQRQGL